MASISEQRLREMEAEMNRFEQEIAPSPYDGLEGYDGGGAGGMIIGSSTFDQVQAQLRQLRHESSRGNAEGGFAPPPPPPPGPPPRVLREAMDLPVSAFAPPPPPPPPPPEPSSEPPPLLPPPPPPPLLNRPAFVPPQLRQRPPPPRPHMPPMGYRGPHGPMGPGPYNQHMMGPGPMGPMMGPGPMGYQDNSYQQGYGGLGPMMGGDGPGPGMGMGGGGYMPNPNMPSPSSAVIEAKPKVIYSAPPIRTGPKKDTKSKSERKEKAGEITAGPSVSVPPELAAAAPSMATAEAAASAEMLAMGQELEEDTMMADMELDMDQAAPTKREKKERKKKFMRIAAGTVWEDPTLAEWDNDDFRMFCGDLGNEVTDEVLTRAFSRYPTFVKAKVVRDRRSNKTKGYGFASFKDPVDFTRAIREMNGKYVGNRPIKLRKSTWKDRSIDVVRKKDKEKKRLGLR